MNPSKIRTGEKLRGIKKHTELSRSLDDSIWVDCDLADCDLSGVCIGDAIFTKCHFEVVCLYWCHAFRATFIDCKFVNCDLRGSFDEAKFVRCGFVNCEVGDNNLGGTTEWENAVAVECVVSGSPLPVVMR